jgi:APA family basic amino acid/polyamine antiporter
LSEDVTKAASEGSFGPGAPDTPRVIGSLQGFAIVAGTMLGIGIFIAPPAAAAQVSSPWAFLMVWAVAGLIALAGAVACGELAALMPRAGGDYVFQREAYGPSIAFASGWVLFAAIFAGSIAAIAVAFCEYQLPVFLQAAGIPWDPKAPMLEVAGVTVKGTQVVALGLVLLFTIVNAVSTRLAAWTQSALTLVPVFCLAGLAVYGIVVGPPEGAITLPSTAYASTPLTLDGLVTAYMVVYFAYSGWNAIIYVGGEVRDPARTLPRSLISGTLAVTALYLLMCVAFVRVLGMEGLSASGEAGTATASALAGHAGKILITALIAIALLSTLNANILQGARVAYAMGRSGAAISDVGKLSRTSQVPVAALVLQVGIASIVVVTGRFEQILQMVSLAMVITGSLTVGAVFVLRWRRPELARPYRATWYPVLPALYLVSSGVVLVVMLKRAFSDEPGAWYPLLGLGILAIAFAAHRFWVTRRRPVLLLVVVGAVWTALGLIATGDARAKMDPEEPASAPMPLPRVDLPKLQAGALEAQQSGSSQALVQLYAVITCQSEAPPVPVAEYASYCGRFGRLKATYQERFKQVAEPWLAERRPKELPPVVLYPFSGADLVSSVLAFPDAILHVHLSLEHGGPPDPLQGLTPEQRRGGLSALLEKTRGLMQLGDSKTEDLRLAHEDELPGKLPMTLVGLAAHGATVVSVRYFRILPSGEVSYYAEGEKEGHVPKKGHGGAKFDARYSNLELAFRLPGSDQLRVMQHVAANLHDSPMKAAQGAGVRAWLKSLGEVAFMTKAATYLLWRPGFSVIRNLAIEQARWMVADASGIPPRYLPADTWEVKVWGEYSCDLLDQYKRGGLFAQVNGELTELWKTKSEGPVPFRFGYVDCQNRKSLMTARRLK